MMLPLLRQICKQTPRENKNELGRMYQSARRKQRFSYWDSLFQKQFNFVSKIHKPFFSLSLPIYLLFLTVDHTKGGMNHFLNFSFLSRFSLMYCLYLNYKYTNLKHCLPSSILNERYKKLHHLHFKMTLDFGPHKKQPTVFSVLAALFQSS